MAESTAGWFGVREKYCSLANKPGLINQIRAAEQAAEASGRYICGSHPLKVSDMINILKTLYPTYHYPKK